MTPFSNLPCHTYLSMFTGRGAFGVVYRATYKNTGIVSPHHIYSHLPHLHTDLLNLFFMHLDVAVKQLIKSNLSDSDIQDFLSEAQTMK